MIYGFTTISFSLQGNHNYFFLLWSNKNACSLLCPMSICIICVIYNEFSIFSKLYYIYTKKTFVIIVWTCIVFVNHWKNKILSTPRTRMSRALFVSVVFFLFRFSIFNTLNVIIFFRHCMYRSRQ